MWMLQAAANRFVPVGRIVPGLAGSRAAERYGARFADPGCVKFNDCSSVGRTQLTQPEDSGERRALQVMV